ncbi:hypothetical protein [Snodgrassella alvi]|uniref:hypothetical protein n=1 Tax=Snodgrassella alvi TaxID=1196083 RepID=UPI000A050FEE|nr:hypothetical protein [Snodgrassella alvi]ORF30662.1 hypothetical protein BGI08_00450 [Snodgrassella alvi]
MNWIYPDVINNLKKKCDSYLNKKISLDEIQSSIYEAEHQILALEEKWLRELLFDVENQIELNRYTIDSEKLEQSVEPIIKNIMTKIS